MLTVILFCVAIILYTYLLYPVLVYLLSKLKAEKYSKSGMANISISIIIPAYNESNILAEKISNTKAISKNYQIQIIVVTSGSTDIDSYVFKDDIIHQHTLERKGKAAALNEGLALATGDYVLFTDANAILSDTAIESLLQCFATDEKCGVAVGKKYLKSSDNSSIEKIYWQWENQLKQAESYIYSATAGLGECMMMKKPNFQLPEYIINDDFWLALHELSTGKKIKVAMAAISFENDNLTLLQEQIRRERIASGNMQWLALYGWNSFIKMTSIAKWIFFSNRICRWILAPIAFVLFLISIVIWYVNVYPINIVLLALAVLIVIAGSKHFSHKYFKFFTLPHYVFFMHIAMVKGYVKYFSGKHSVIWKKVR